MLQQARIYYNTQAHRMHKLEESSEISNSKMKPRRKFKEPRMNKIKKEIKLSKYSKKKGFKSRNAKGGMGGNNMKSLPEKQNFVSGFSNNAQNSSKRFEMNSHRKGKLTTHGSKGNIPKVDFKGILYKQSHENFNNNSHNMHSKESSEASIIDSPKIAKKEKINELSVLKVQKIHHQGKKRQKYKLYLVEDSNSRDLTQTNDTTGRKSGGGMSNLESNSILNKNQLLKSGNLKFKTTSQLNGRVKKAK